MKNMNRETYYEWDVETINPETGNVEDHDHQTTFADCLLCINDENMAIVLVKTWENFNTGDGGRAWAYFDMETMTFPEEFDNGDKVPKRFLLEVKKATK